MEVPLSSSQYRSQLENKRKQRVAAESKAGDQRSKESKKRSEAAKARAAAAKSTSPTTANSKLREAVRRDSEAASAGKEAERWQGKASACAKQEISLMQQLARAEQSEADAAERKRLRAAQQDARQSAAVHAGLEHRIGKTQAAVTEVAAALRPPKQEKLRVLMLGASSEGDLRVGREQKRIRAAIEAALHRDWIELDVRPAATAADLLDGVGRFRPHVVHFSGHSHTDLVVFEDEKDEHHQGRIVAAAAFANAIGATDEPPLLVVLNSCHSASQIDRLVRDIVPFAIGMADEVEDADAINYAAQFYASVANGQSIRSAHLAGQSALELAGLSGAELPTLACATGFDPATTVLVRPPA